MWFGIIIFFFFFPICLIICLNLRQKDASICSSSTYVLAAKDKKGKKKILAEKNNNNSGLDDTAFSDTSSNIINTDKIHNTRKRPWTPMPTASRDSDASDSSTLRCSPIHDDIGAVQLVPPNPKARQEIIQKAKQKSQKSTQKSKQSSSSLSSDSSDDDTLKNVESLQTDNLTSVIQKISHEGNVGSDGRIYQMLDPCDKSTVISKVQASQGRTKRDDNELIMDNHHNHHDEISDGIKADWSLKDHVKNAKSDKEVEEISKDFARNEFSLRATPLSISPYQIPMEITKKNETIKSTSTQCSSTSTQKTSHAHPMPSHAPTKITVIPVKAPPPTLLGPEAKKSYYALPIVTGEEDKERRNEVISTTK